LISEEQGVQASADRAGSDIRKRERPSPEGIAERQVFIFANASKDLKTGTVEGIKKQLGLK